MDTEQARTIISDWAKENFGRFIEVREIVTLRKATGRVWVGQLYCTTRDGEIQVGKTILDDYGQILETMDVDMLIDSLVTIRSSRMSQMPEDDFGGLDSDMDFSSFASEGLVDDSESEDEIDDAFDSIIPKNLQQKANELIATGEHQNLLEARHLLPQLLTSQERRGQVLQQMAELEMLLGDVDTGIQYLEAAAREYNDLANFDGLAEVAELAVNVMSEEQFVSSSIKRFFDQTRNRLRPMNTLKEAPLFIGVGDEEFFALEGVAQLIKISESETVLREGELANRAFIIRTGTLSVRLESPDGEMKVVRSCFPGDFIGESSVLGEYGATCTATVQGEMESTLWQFDGPELRSLCEEYPEIKMRIESAKTLHQLDSFISMNENTSSLDVSMRDKLLSCISGIARVPKGTVLNAKGDIPKDVHLIVNGTIVYKTGDTIQREYKADTFAGLRDSLHELPLEGDFISGTDCLLVYLAPDKLREIAQNAPPEVIAVLEKLE